MEPSGLRRGHDTDMLSIDRRSDWRSRRETQERDKRRGPVGLFYTLQAGELTTASIQVEVEQGRSGKDHKKIIKKNGGGFAFSFKVTIRQNKRKTTDKFM